MKKVVLVFFIGILLVGCDKGKDNQNQQQQSDPNNSAVTTETIYKNDQYGLEFSLPDSWKGYTITDDKWEGVSESETQQQIIETGPLISIRHPQWRAEKPRQDIPIMVFTLSQWDSLQNNKFHIGAAPVGPSEIDRNSKYVFALPARYNYSYLEGYEEVEEILDSKPLKPIENFKGQ